MKKQFVKILSLSALLIGTAIVYSSCDKDDDDNVPDNNGTDVVNTDSIAKADSIARVDSIAKADSIAKVNSIKLAKKIYILNEGSWGGNNSTLDVYYPNGESDYQSKIFAAANGKGLGDTGEDLIAYGDRLYVSVWGSNYLAKLDKSGKIVEQYSFTATDGQPRHLAAKDGFIYVSTYGGKVMKFDTTTIAASVGAVEVGPHPEEICISGNTLYAAIAGDYTVAYDSTLAVVDLAAFSLKEKFTVALDPENVMAIGEKLYVIHYDTLTWAREIMEVNPATKNSTKLDEGAKMATDGTNLYYVKSFTDYSDYPNTKTVTSFVKKGSNDCPFDLTSTPELSSSMVYLFEIDPDNGDFYIGTTDSMTPGTIYRFDKTGKFITKFETSGTNPSHAAFVK
ncbi:MAG: hypothetical protein IJ911_07595 [Salinivirgaceae bacterium]|nr:hypothetical protein [Salinivirgaceae bacterium]